MRISVIVPAYNSAATIEPCLQSLISQSLKPEIIVVDDGSLDQTVKIVRSFSDIKLLQQTHQGPGAARNLGAKKAQGQVLVFVDSDMEFSQNFLTDLTRPIRQGKSKGSWSGNEQVANWDNLWARCWNYNQGRYSPQMTGSSGQRPVFRAIVKSEFERVKGFTLTGYTDDWSLADKLGHQPAVTQAKFYHTNPDNLLKVFLKALWIGKRQYKLGRFGAFIALVRANAGFSVVIGLGKALKTKTPGFIVFKLVYDLGILLGALQKLCLGSSY